MVSCERFVMILIQVSLLTAYGEGPILRDHTDGRPAPLRRPRWVRLMVSVSASHVVGRRFAPRLGYTLKTII